MNLTETVFVYTFTADMGQPPKPDHLRRSKLFPLRLTPNEMRNLKAASRKLGESVAAILRNGGLLYVQLREGKDGSLRKKEREQ